MTLNWSMNGKEFSVFVKHFLVPNLWEGAGVVMDNLPTHFSGGDWTFNSNGNGASILNLSPYSPDFNPIELWWSEVKAFLRHFSPTTTKMVDILLFTALEGVNIKHFKNWFPSCWYCNL